MDCAIIVSHTAEIQRKTICIAKIAKESGAKIIVITSQANSPLAKLGDVVFNFKSLKKRNFVLKAWHLRYRAIKYYRLTICSSPVLQFKRNRKILFLKVVVSFSGIKE